MPRAPRRRGRLGPARPLRRRDDRLPAHRRGYDHAWAALRDAYAAEHPLCEVCLGRGRTVPVHEVDHVIPFEGPDDPLRLDWSNLQSLCRPCHAAKTARDQRAGRGAAQPP